MLLSSLRNTFYPSLNDISDWHISYTWISLINWIPLFVCFWGFQEYLKGKLNGEWIYYFTNGEVKQKVNYKS